MSQPGQIAFPQVWLLPLPQGAPVLAGDSANQTQSPRWSATGQLAYYDKTRQGFVIQDPHGGKADFFPNQTGEGGDWSPDGKFFIAPEIFYVPVGSDQPTATSHLISFNRLDGKTTDLTKDDNLEDTGPAFSPNGSSLAFARKYLDITRWTPGRQIWLMKADGSGARHLTDNAFDNHYDFAWSQDSRRLAYVISNQAKPTDPPELWLVNADGSNPVQLMIGGYAPQWMP
jgi:Tol biopolymer transport system component